MSMTSQCHSGVDGRSTDHPATGHIVCPDGRKIMTMCEPHATEVIDEYRTHLGERWTFEPFRDPDCCRTCGDEYGRAKLMAGECDGCRNEAAGLCWCGADPLPGYDMCGQCSADEAADVRFHAMHEGAL